MKRSIRWLLLRLPFFGRIYKEYVTFKTPFPPGHYANPYPSIVDAQKLQGSLIEDDGSVPGVNLNEENQLSFIFKCKEFFDRYPYSASANAPYRFFYDNSMFGFNDSLFLHFVLMMYHPRHIIEIGSGYSSAQMLDSNEFLQQQKMSLTFIDPYPDRLFSLLNKEDLHNVKILVNPIQDVPIEIFDELEENDILFLDTSHILKTGSDLSMELFKIIPRLKKGVIIHIHDIFWPFEYTLDWVKEMKAYNEAYFIRAFLMFNDSYEILLWNNYLFNKHQDWFHANMGKCMLHHPGGSLWLRKTK